MPSFTPLPTNADGVRVRNLPLKGGGYEKRDELLLAMGIVLKDTKNGTTWEVAR